MDGGAWQVTIHGVAEPDLTEATAGTRANAGDPGSVPGLGGCLGAATEPVHRSLGATATEAMSPEPMLRNETPLQGAACAPQLQMTSCSLQLGKSRRSNRDPAQPKINK